MATAIMELPHATVTCRHPDLEDQMRNQTAFPQHRKSQARPPLPPFCGLVFAIPASRWKF